MKKILIVDDQQLYLMSLEVALRNTYEVKTASNYNEALNIVKTGIDIALIDIRLDESDDQNTDGLKLLEWIRKNDPSISSYVMSAYREFSYAEKALNLGAKHFFKKPIDIIDLLTVLKEKG